MFFVLFIISSSAHSVFGQTISDDVTVHCLDETEFWRQGIVGVSQIGDDGKVFVNQNTHIISSILHKTNRSETVHLRIQITSPHPDSKMDQTKQITFHNCDSVALVDWVFTPQVPGRHNLVLTIQEGGSGYSSNFMVQDHDGKSLRDYIPSPLQQFKSGVSPSNIICQVPLQMVLRLDGAPACVKQPTMVQLWNQGWVRHADDYTKFSSEQLLKEFQSKILDEKSAIQITQDYLVDNHLRLDVNMSSPDFTIKTRLTYVQISPISQLKYDVTYATGLPVEPMPPWIENLYRNPQWWTELQKDYLGMKNSRVEQGNLVWVVDYRDCPMCISSYQEFVVDAITGKIIKVPRDEFFK